MEQAAQVVGRGRLARAHASNLASRAAAALIVARRSAVTEDEVLVRRAAGWLSLLQVFKKYSQMKLRMKREALEKLNRRASEMAPATGERMRTVMVQ